MKMLLEQGLLDGDCMTVTGKTLAENLQGSARASPPGSRSCDPLANPIKPTGHIQILRGNLAPDGAVAKITGKEGTALRGPGARLRLRRGHAARPRAQARSARAT